MTGHFLIETLWTVTGKPFPGQESVADSLGAWREICLAVTFIGVPCKDRQSKDGQLSIGEKLAVPRIHFQQQLAELKDKLLAMAALAQQAMESALDAYLQRDSGLCPYGRQNETG